MGIAIGLALLSTAIQATAAVKEGRAVERASKRTGKLLARQADETRLQGIEAADISRQQTRRALASQRAILGASGLAQAGSFSFAQTFSEREGFLKQESILAGAESEALSLLGQAKSKRAFGRSARRGGLLSGLGLATGGVAKSGLFS